MATFASDSEYKTPATLKKSDAMRERNRSTFRPPPSLASQASYQDRRRMAELSADFTSDSLSGYAYGYDFARSQRHMALPQYFARGEGVIEHRGPSRKEWLMQFEKVVDMPDGIGRMTFKVDPETVVCFHGRHWLSNLYKSLLVIDGHVYPTAEHYYQACKLYLLGGPHCSNRIRNINDAGQAKIAAKELLRTVVGMQHMDQWKMTDGPKIMQHALIHKFVQHPELRQKLLDTGDGLLVHAFEGDKVFGSGTKVEDFQEWAKENKGETITVPRRLDDHTLSYCPKVAKGKNALGVLLMMVRADIRDFFDKQNDGGKIDPDDPVMCVALEALKLTPKVEEEKKSRKEAWEKKQKEKAERAAKEGETDEDKEKEKDNKDKESSKSKSTVSAALSGKKSSKGSKSSKD